jgi:gliding motility-associated-like protein
MRKIISVIYLLCFFSLLNSLSAQVTFTASSPTANCDDAQFCVEISVANFDSVTSFQHVYDWDTTIMQLVSFTDLMPEGFGIAPSMDSTDIGRGPYSWFNFPFTTLNDNFVIAELCFVPNSIGSSNFSFVGSPTTLLEVTDVNGVTPGIYNNGVVTVQDIEDPVIVCHGDVSIESNGSNVSGLAPVSATDNCGLASINYNMVMNGSNVGSGVNDASGEFFSPGTTTVTYTALDDAGNVGTCSFDVILTPPPPDTGSLQFIPEINFDCDAGTVSIDMLVVNFDSITGMQFGIQWDTAMVTPSVPFTVNALPPAASYNTANDSTILFLWFPFSGNPLTLNDSTTIFTMNFDLNGNFSSPVLNFVSFTGIPIGVGQIQNGLDINLVQDVDFFFMPEIINVNDNVAPSITGCPSDIVMSTDGGLCTANVSWTIPTITDNCGLDTVIVSDMPGVFPVGIDTVTYIAIDLGGNSDTCSFTITVTDDENPVISCPGSVTVDANFGSCSNNTVNIGTATATDNCGIASISSNAPASFPVGATTVTWTAIDVNGNISTCTQLITIVDNELPTITCPANITQCPGTLVVLGTPTTNDNCGIASVTNNAPGSYPIGTTPVTWTVVDVNGNSATCIQNVIIEDDIAPTITCPVTDAIDVIPGTCSAVYSNNLTPIVSDNCDSNPSVTYTIVFGGSVVGSGSDNATGETFNVGSSTLNYYVTDDAGNIDSCSVTVQVNDNEFPVLTCPMDTTIFVSAATTDTIVNNISLSATDNCGIASISYAFTGELTGPGIGSDASGTSFPAGLTNVTYYVTDVNGNIDSCDFNVIVQTVTNDLIDCPSDVIQNNDTDFCNAQVDGIAPILLVPSGNIASITYSFSGDTSGSGNDDASGEIFNVGSTTVQYIATDNFGNMDTCIFNVTINDTQIPVWSNCPTDITVDAMANCMASATWVAPSASDNCGVEQIFSSHIPGSVFPFGSTPVSYVAIDTAGNIGSCTFNVIVVDNTPPIANNCPGNITVSAASGNCDAVASWNPITGTDDCSAVTVTCTHLPGATFPVGTTTVVCTLTDVSGNASTCSFDVTVIDNTAPIPVGCPADITVSASLANCSAMASWIPPTFLDCPPVNVTSTHDPGDIFPLGITTVIYIAIDPVGNDTTCTFTVTVIDDVPPVANCPADITVNSLANNCGASVNWPPPTATDNCDTNVFISTDPVPGTFFPIGTSTVTVIATDDAGNQDTCYFDVTVNDAIAPVFTCPTQPIVISVDGTVEPGTDPLGLILNTSANGVCDSLIIDYSDLTATDNCGIESIGLFNNSLPSGSAFPIGVTTIEYIAFDSSGNFALCSFDIEVLPLDAVGVVILQDDEVCEGADIQLLTNVTSPGATFEWAGPNTFSSTDPSPSVVDVTTLDAGFYTVTVTYLSGCTAIGAAELTVNQADAVTASSNSPLCTGDDLELSVVVDPGATVLWTGPDNFTSDLENPVIVDPTSVNMGQYTVVVTYVGGCTATSTTSVSITSLPAPEIDMDCLTDICLGSSCVLSGTEYSPAPDFYNWEAIPALGAGLPVDTDNNQITITPTQPGTYIFNYSVELNGCESEQATQVIIVHDAPNAEEDAFDIIFETEQDILVTDNDDFNTNIGINISVLEGGTSNGTLINNNDGTFTYTPDPGFIGVDQFVYEICYDCGPELCSSTLVTLTVSDDRDCVFPTVITPNFDGLNDYLFINCLEPIGSGLFPNNEIIIYNIWGDEVFTAAPYQNNWAGTYDGEDLPDGTYYVVFKLDNNSELIKQYITIFR